MSLPSGTSLGPYEITAPLGKGGMGEVYMLVIPQQASTSGDLILVKNWLSSLETLFEEQ